MDSEYVAFVPNWEVDRAESPVLVHVGDLLVAAQTTQSLLVALHFKDAASMHRMCREPQAARVNSRATIKVN